MRRMADGERVPGPGLRPNKAYSAASHQFTFALVAVFGLRLETVHPPAIHLERVDIPMPSSDKSSTSKVLHVFEGHPSFYCSNCSAVIASISHSTSLDCT